MVFIKGGNKNNMKTWKDIKSPDELMAFLEKNDFISIDKWSVLRYYANSNDPQDQEFFIKLLDSKYYGAAQVFDRLGGKFYNWVNPDSVKAMEERLLKICDGKESVDKIIVETTPGGWRYVKDVNRLMTFVKEGLIKDAWTLFRYYAKSTGEENTKIFKELLEAGLLSPTAISKTFFGPREASVWGNPEHKQIAREFVSEKLGVMYGINEEDAKYNDLSYVKKLEGSFHGREKLYFHLKCLASSNQEMFLNLASMVKSQYITEWFFNDSALESDKMLQKLIEEKRRDVFLGVKVSKYAQKMEEDYDFRKKVRDGGFSDYKFLTELFINGKTEDVQTMLELDIVPASRIKALYPASAIKKLNPLVADYLKEDAWKYFSDPWFVSRRITDENKWEVLEYLVENKPETAQYLVKEMDFFRGSRIYKHYKDSDISSFSVPMQKLINASAAEYNRMQGHNQKRAEVVKQKRLELRPREISRWLENETNALKSYCSLYGGRKIASVEEYKYIANKFIASGLTPRAFCAKYHIYDVYGFKAMLNLNAGEDEAFSKKLKSKTTQNQEDSSKQIKCLIEAVVVGKMNVATFIDKLDELGMSLKDAVSYINENCQNYKVGAIFVIRVIDYFYNRLNEYSGSIEKEDINKLLSQAEFNFITTESDQIVMEQQGKANLGEKFYFAIKPFAVYAKNACQEKVNGTAADKIRTRLCRFGDVYNRNKLLGTSIGTSGDNVVEVNDDILNTAEEYLKENGLYVSEYSVTKVVRAIASGKIKLRETEREEEKKVDLSRLSVASIEEYFDVFDGQCLEK